MSTTTVSTSFPVFGVEAVVAATGTTALERALPEVHATLAAFDLACSRFRPDSELIRLGAARGPVPVSPLLFEAITQAVRAARITGGAVDPTVGSSLIACGYDRDFDLLSATPARVVRFRRAAGWQTIALDRARRTVALPAGVTLDLGAVAKAMAADAAAARACAAAGGGSGVLVSLGGDLATAGTPPHAGWRVRVTDDHRAGVDAPGQWIAIRNGGVATSSTMVRRWQVAGAGELHHVLDPASGRPAAGPWRTASVAAATCLDANIASTAALVDGEQAAEMLQVARLPSRLVGHDGGARHLCGWPEQGEDSG